MDILESGKIVSLNSEEQLSFLILTSYAMKFGSVRHLFDIRQVMHAVMLQNLLN